VTRQILIAAIVGTDPERGLSLRVELRLRRGFCRLPRELLDEALGVFARLAPQKLGATTVASWYLATFTGSLAAGQVGRLWSHLGHIQFFILLAAIASLAAALLFVLDRPTRRILAQAAPPSARDLTDVPEGIARPQNA